MSDDTRRRVERLLEVAVFAPLGLAMTLRDMAPTFVNMFVSRGRAEVDRRQQQVEQRVKTVRSTGEVALAFGVPMVKDKLNRRVESLVARAGGEAPGRQQLHRQQARKQAQKQQAQQGATRAKPAGDHPVTALRRAPANGARAVDELAIPGYDELSAGQVVERLVGLSSPELVAVREYEGTHRNRRTILSKIEQLAGS